MTDDRRDHWEHVYTTKQDNEVSWFEDSPEVSLTLLRAAGLTPSMAVIDIGGGASRLVDTLLAEGQDHVSVLDLSAAALSVARTRLNDPTKAAWITGDITQWTPDRTYDLWHDRAAFHFLTDPADQRTYADTLHTALKPGGRAVIGTFALDGPERCSGLPVSRYDAETLAAVLGPRFRLLGSQKHEHTTPWASVQKFQFSTFERI